MAQEIKMSAAGLKAMQEELEYLKTVRRKELAEEIKEARSHGDLSENSEYDEAKNTQGLVENRITELEQMVKNAVVIDESELSVENVSVGTHVTIQMEGEDETEEYDIVGRTEADPLNGKISDESPAEKSCCPPAIPSTTRCWASPTLQTEPSGRKLWKNRRRTPHRACLRASRCRCAARSWQTCRLQAATPLP